MDKDEVLLKQYEFLMQRFLHLGRLFWHVPTIFIALCVLLANVLKDSTPPLLDWYIVGAGVLFLLVGYIAWRHKANQDKVGETLSMIEEELEKSTGVPVYRQPLPKQFGSRFLMVTVLLLAGIALVVGGVVQLL